MPGETPSVEVSAAKPNRKGERRIAVTPMKKNPRITVQSKEFDIVNTDLVKIDLFRFLGLLFYLRRSERAGKTDLFQERSAENIRVENIGGKNSFGTVCLRVVANEIGVIGERNFRAGIETLVFRAETVNFHSVGAPLVENIPITTGENQFTMASRDILETKNNVILLGTSYG